MSKLIAVSIAVGGELTSLHWWPPRNLDAVMGRDYHFDQDSLSSFLCMIRDKLENGIGEVYTFAFDADFARAALTMAVGELIGAIEERAEPLGIAKLLMVDGTGGAETVAMRKLTLQRSVSTTQTATASRRPKRRGGQG